MCVIMFSVFWFIADFLTLQEAISCQGIRTAVLYSKNLQKYGLKFSANDSIMHSSEVWHRILGFILSWVEGLGFIFVLFLATKNKKSIFFERAANQKILR